MENINGKIEAIANILGVLGTIGGIIFLFSGISQYVDYKENYAWRVFEDYSYLGTEAISTIALGIGMILSSIAIMFVLFGFVQMLENSNKLVVLAEGKEHFEPKKAEVAVQSTEKDADR